LTKGSAVAEASAFAEPASAGKASADKLADREGGGRKKAFSAKRTQILGGYLQHKLLMYSVLWPAPWVVA